MKCKVSLQAVSVVLTVCLGSLTTASASGILLAAAPAQAQMVAFRDTYGRDDVAPPEDSLDTTESGPGLVVLDYRELGGCCGSPTVSDIAQIEGGSLFVRGQSTNTDPAWAELDNAGPNSNFQVEVEFLAKDVDGSVAANSTSFIMRNAGTGGDGTIFTPGSISFELFLDGSFTVRGFVTGMNDNILLAQGVVDAAAFATADLDGDGRLETSEPFTLRVVLESNSFSFDFNGVNQILSLDLSGLPDPPEGGDRLLFGRNRWQFAPTEIEIRFDNLGSPLACPDFSGDGQVDNLDIQGSATRWPLTAANPDPDNNPNTPNYEPIFDLNLDGGITVWDVMVVAAAWGPCP